MPAIEVSHLTKEYRLGVGVLQNLKRALLKIGTRLNESLPNYQDRKRWIQIFATDLNVTLGGGISDSLPLDDLSICKNRPYEKPRACGLRSHLGRLLRDRLLQITPWGIKYAVLKITDT